MIKKKSGEFFCSRVLSGKHPVVLGSFLMAAGALFPRRPQQKKKSLSTLRRRGEDEGGASEKFSARFRKQKFFTGLIALTLLFSGNLVPAHAALEQSVREIGIRAAVSPSFKKNPDWQREIRDRVIFANQIFEKQFAVHFTVKSYEAWNPIDEKRETSLLIEELKALFPLGSGEVVIGFHKMSEPFGKDAVLDLDTVGTAQFFRGIIIIRDPFQDLTSEQRGFVLTHEMAHLFGSVHVGGEPAIMNPALAANPPLTLDPENSEILKLTRKVDFEKGLDSFPPQTIDSLIQIYEKLIRKNPHSDFYYQLGKFYEKQNQKARAVSIWEEAIRQQYDNPWIHWELGNYYYESSRYDAAIQEIGSAIAFFVLPSQKKERAQAFNFLGVAYYEKGNIESALVTWLKGLSFDPDNPQLQGNLAAAYLSQGNLDQGIRELEKLSAKYPGDINILSNLGVAYTMKKEPARAADFFNQALSQKTAYKAPQNIPQLVKQENGEEEDSPEKREQNTTALMKDVSEASLRMNLGASYLALGRTEEALKELEHAQKLEPQNPDILQNLAQAQLKLRIYDKAVQALQEALRYKPGDGNLYAMLASGYAMSGKHKEAIVAAREGIRYGDKLIKANLYKNIGILYAQEQQYKEAEIELKNSLNTNWNDADCHVKLGYVYGDSGQLDAARRSFQSALSVDPKNEEAKKALASMGNQK